MKIASIILLAYNELHTATRPCIESVLRNTTPGTYELILVDNASTDGTPDYFNQLAAEYRHVTICLNSANKGFAAGNNDGLRLAQGRYIILLNNDTLVMAGWLERLLSVFSRDGNVGMAGPVSNSVGNEQRIELPGLTESNFETIAGEYCGRQAGFYFKTVKLGFYCVAMPRAVFEEVGYLDEQFGLGTFEDDDYCLRIRKAGHDLVVVEDCFVYHKGSVSFKKLSFGQFSSLVATNKARFLSKHGEPWALTDIALSYWQRIKDDMDTHTANGVYDRDLERVHIRLENFYHLLIQIKQEETKGSLKVPVPEPAVTIEGTWMQRWNNFKRYFLYGTMRERVAYIRSKREFIARLRYRSIVKKLLPIIHDPSWSSDKCIVVMTSTIDYGYMKQRPQHLADALAAAGCLVLYLTKNYNKDNVKMFKKVSENLFLVHDKAAGHLHHILKSEQVVLFQLWPNNINLKDFIPHSRHIYDIMDDISLLDLDINTLEAQHQLSMRHADLITVSSDLLYEAIPENYRSKALLVPNGVSAEFIEALKKKHALPAEFANWEGVPRVGYYGAIAEWFDFDLVQQVAQELPDWRFTFIGPVLDVREQVRRLQRNCSNVQFLDPRPHLELIPYLQHFDICIIPFLSKVITNAVSPVKLFEYMAAGKPVVTTDMRECRKYYQVRVASNPREFVDHLREALNTIGPELASSLKYVAAQNTWSDRVTSILKPLSLL